MSKPKQTNPYDLTDEEVAALASTRIPDEVKAFTARRQRVLGAETVALQKVAARAMAEVQAIQAIRALDREHGEVSDLAEAKTAIDVLKRRIEAIEITGAAKDRKIERLTASPAAVVHSDD